MSPSDNPGKRLYSFLSRAQSTGGSTVRAGFASLFQVQENDTREIFRGLADMSDLADEAPSLLEWQGRTDTVAAYADHLPMIKRFFAVENFDAGWAAYKQTKLRNEDIATVKVCASILAASTAQISESELDGLRRETDDLYDTISNAEIDRDLKRVLLDSVQKIKQAIHDYQVWGE
jgi:hypothetical protein